METVRCKFVCNEITEILGSHYDGQKYVPQKQYGAKFRVVTGTSEENKQFFASTPGGSFEVVCVTKRFEPGKEYFLDITEAT